MKHYADALREGIIHTKDLNEAAQLYQRCIDEGDTNSMVCYGEMLETGKGVKKNRDEALRYYKMAMDRDNYLGREKYNNLASKSKCCNIF